MPRLILGDCLTMLTHLPDNSFDSLVTDPPAGIAFMGKDWDKDKGGRDAWIAWMRDVMREALRVLKPGAHGLVWALPRTSHWTATALEDAGFEVRDVVTHLFGSGFPKSLDISKAIDKAAGKEGSFGQPKSAAHAGWIERGRMRGGEGHEGYQRAWMNDPSAVDKNARTYIPTTTEAKQWQGFGTALKPSFEAWLLVAKPFTTVPLDAILSDLNSILRDSICHQLPAKFAEQVSTSNLRDYNGQQFDFAQWLVDVWHIVEPAEPKQKMGTSISPEMGSIFLSIVSLWKSILDALLQNRNTFTTSMESSLITELKTLRYSILQTTQENITQADSQINTELSIAIVVRNLLLSGLLRLKGLMEIFVQENVSMQAEGLPEEQKRKLAADLATIKGVLSEHWILVRKPLSEKTVAKNVLKWGTGGLNIDGCRVEGAIPVVPQPAFNTTGSIYNMKTGEGRNGEMSRAEGRFPANLVLDEVAAEMLDEQSGISKSTGGTDRSKNKNGWSGLGADTKRGNCGGLGDSGGASRFFYVAKASKRDKGTDNSHPTVKPTKLMEYLIRLVTPPGGMVLDPFMGSGSTGVAALREGFEFTGIEASEEYLEIAKARLNG